MPAVLPATSAHRSVPCATCLASVEPLVPDGDRHPRGATARVLDARWGDGVLRDVLGALSTPAVHLDAAGAVAFVNDAFLDATGWARAEVLGADWDDGFVPAGCATRALFAAALGGAAGRGQGELFTRDGDRRVIAWDAVPLRDAAGRAAGVACVGRDVTDERRAARERARLTGELAAMGERDALTGLPNRRGWTRGTEHAARVAARTRRADAVVAVHVDALAATYAAYGEAAGDDALCAVAEALRAAVRDSDIVARVSDAAFAVYAVGTAAPNHGASAAARVRAALDRQNAHALAAGRAFELGCRVGVAERAPGEDLGALLTRAESAATAELLAHHGGSND